VPVSFVTHFHASTGRPRKHPLYPMIKALLIQRIFSIPTDTLLIIFLKYSQELQVFCGFRVVPDASKFTRFKQDFLMDLQSMFDHLVDITEPICQRIDSNLASMSILDTSGIEAWVTENNPKYANRIIKQLKAFAKAHNFDKNFDPYKAAYGSMPAHATANPAIQQMYINGHFCYAYKFGIVTNGLGFEKAFIPLRTKLSMEENGYTFNENGVPCCPHDSTLPMKREGSKSHLR
ncbi:transposase, partial [Mediterraneibacter massiliensis]